MKQNKNQYLLNSLSTSLASHSYLPSIENKFEKTKENKKNLFVISKGNLQSTIYNKLKNSFENSSDYLNIIPNVVIGQDLKKVNLKREENLLFTKQINCNYETDTLSINSNNKRVSIKSQFKRKEKRSDSKNQINNKESKCDSKIIEYINNEEIGELEKSIRKNINNVPSSSQYLNYNANTYKKNNNRIKSSLYNHCLTKKDSLIDIVNKNKNHKLSLNNNLYDNLNKQENAFETYKKERKHFENISSYFETKLKRSKSNQVFRSLEYNSVKSEVQNLLISDSCPNKYEGIHKWITSLRYTSDNEYYYLNIGTNDNPNWKKVLHKEKEHERYINPEIYEQNKIIMKLGKFYNNISNLKFEKLKDCHVRIYNI